MLTLNYILSQVFIILAYSLMATTFYLKKRKMILLVGNIATILFALSYMFLSAWTGVIMNAFSIIRNVTFLIQNRYTKDKNKITWVDWIILIALYAVIVALTTFTYAGFLSLMSVFATCLFTFAVWQKSPKIYRLLGCFSSILWIIYNIYVFSIFGLILESILLVFAIIGTVKAYKTNLSVGNEKE